MPAAFNQRLLLQAKLVLIVALLRRKRQLLRKKQYRRKRIWVRENFQERNEQLCLQMCNEALGAVQNAKYLGAHIDISLDWEKRIQEISKKFHDLLVC